IRCSLINCSLDEAPPYDAISYCWGSPSPSHAVFADGASLPVPQSAQEILSSRAADLTTAGVRYRWLDAICIDQSSTSDKTQQVRLMRDIYGHAERTVVYLGEPSLSPAESFVL
ncbi:heterokaryon incompatibility protein-domain-containing protein, partial [Cercophora newfieldiana]